MQNPHEITVLIGLDDTDNLESCGTGFHARTIAKHIDEQSLGRTVHITRHQLLVSPLVPYTSHNSAACIRVTTDPDQLSAIEELARTYLEMNSAEGADAGLCVAAEHEVSHYVQRFGWLCKRRVMQQADARHFATSSGLRLHGITGSKDGMIGALAAVGLHAQGCDGRLLWLKGLRELVDQTISVEEVFARTGVQAIQSLEGALIDVKDEFIAMGPWPRCVLLDGEAVLMVEKGEPHAKAHWRVADKQYLKQY